jgi:hypothetical protein
MIYKYVTTYSGKLSIEFADLPFPADSRARFKGNVEIVAPDGPASSKPFERFTTTSAIGLEMRWR